MISLLLATVLLDEWSSLVVKSAYEGGTELQVANRLVDLPFPKICPLNGWEFQNETRVSHIENDKQEVRFRVFAQKPQSKLLSSSNVGNFLARLYDYNMSVLRLDHSPQFQNRQVTVYLCNSGQAGGQQLFGLDSQDFEGIKTPQSVNTVYIYDVTTLDDSVEACRELAHEYGHATLPPVKIKGGREEWANGHLGERLYLFNLAQQLKTNKVSVETLFGAKSDDIQRYLKTKVYPLVQRVKKEGPNLASLAKSDDQAFEAYLALACYAFAVLPSECFRRAIILNPNESATGFAKSLIESVNERSLVELKITDQSPVWIPIGNGNLEGAKILERAGKWAKVLPKGKIIIKNLTD